MDPIIQNVVKNAKLLYQNMSSEPITKTNPYLYAVSHGCLTHRDIMWQVPAEEAGYVGFSFLQILDLTDDTSVFQIYSTITFYYLEKALMFGFVDSDRTKEKYVLTLNSAIIDMNIGAQSICRTFAQAQGMTPGRYIDFSNLNALPDYVRDVLLAEYSYLVEMEQALKLLNSRIECNVQVNQRYKFLKDIIGQGYFSGVRLQSEAYNKGKSIRARVYKYVSEKIEEGDIIFT